MKCPVKLAAKSDIYMAISSMLIGGANVGFSSRIYMSRPPSPQAVSRGEVLRGVDGVA